MAKYQTLNNKRGNPKRFEPGSNKVNERLISFRPDVVINAKWILEVL